MNFVSRLVHLSMPLEFEILIVTFSKFVNITCYLNPSMSKYFSFIKNFQTYQGFSYPFIIQHRRHKMLSRYCDCVILSSRQRLIGSFIDERFKYFKDIVASFVPYDAVYIYFFVDQDICSILFLVWNELDSMNIALLILHEERNTLSIFKMFSILILIKPITFTVSKTDFYNLQLFY